MPKNDYSKMSNEELLKEYSNHYIWELEGISNSLEEVRNEVLSRMK